MKTYVVSGAASGIGAATTALLREQGHRVVTVDLHEADVVADLSTPAGRDEAVRQVQSRADEIHGVIPCAGVAGLTGVDPELVVSVNYFGAIGLVRGLRPQLAAGGAASVVLLASNSVTCQPGWATDVADACLSDDEKRRARPRPASRRSTSIQRPRPPWPGGPAARASRRSGPEPGSGSTPSPPA